MFFEPDYPQQEIAPAFEVDTGICSPENPSACIVSFEDADVMLGQAPAYDQMAVATNSAYSVPLNSVSISVPMIEDGLSVKEKMAQRELEKQDLALTPVDGASVICNGEDCANQLFKTETQKEVQTTITEEKTLRAVTLNDKIAYGEANHDWEAKAGDTMRSLLRQWGESSGWTVVWKIDRDYRIGISVDFADTAILKNFQETGFIILPESSTDKLSARNVWSESWPVAFLYLANLIVHEIYLHIAVCIYDTIL